MNARRVLVLAYRQVEQPFFASDIPKLSLFTLVGLAFSSSSYPLATPFRPPASGSPRHGSFRAGK